MKKLLMNDDFIESLLYANSIEESLISGEGIKQRDARLVEDIPIKEESVKPEGQEVAPRSYHYHKHISSICTCDKDYRGD